MTYFISDLHFGHANCLAFDNRPFSTIEEQDEEIVRRWNERVKDRDTVYILGDFSWYLRDKTVEVMSRLNGNKVLITGNHDDKLLKNQAVRDLFIEIVDYKELYINKTTMIVLCHYPIPCFKNHYYNQYHFYGHVHSGFEWNMMEKVKQEMKSLYDKPCNMYNVGCMMPYMDYTPRTFEEIISCDK